MELIEIGPGPLAAICRGARRFYREAAEVSRSHRQIVTLQNLELQRAAQAQELEKCVDSPGPPNLLPLVLSVQDDDARVLELCEALDRETILAYRREIARSPAREYRGLLERHLEQILVGRERCDSLRSKRP
ncbi:MAG: hypothetical protein HY319_26875 [Armatimonadetes bacterium]|nr:hypothetical protein [Armatimonadota bacterium]